MTADETIAIRRAEPGDEAGMSYVHVASWRATYAGLLPPQALRTPSLQERSRFWRRAVDGSQPDRLAYVALDEGHQIVGFASSGPQRGSVDGYDAELYDIYLLPDVQRRGIGRRLLKIMSEALLDRGFGSLAVWMPARIPSCGFCRALGGRPVAEKIIELDGLSLSAVAFGWPSLASVGT